MSELEAAGVRPVAISVDPIEVTREHTNKLGTTYTFLSDPGARIAQQYGILHKGAGIGGADIARAAEFLIDKSGTVRWRNLTEDYRVRARPEELLSAARSLR